MVDTLQKIREKKFPLLRFIFSFSHQNITFAFLGAETVLIYVPNWYIVGTYGVREYMKQERWND